MDTVLIILGIILIAVYGFAAVLYPEELWKLEHCFDVKNGEPTEWYIEKSRLRGLLCIAVDIIVIIVLIISKIKI